MGKLSFATIKSAGQVVEVRDPKALVVASRASIAGVFEQDRLHGITDRDMVDALSKSVAHWIVWEQQPTGVILDADCDWLIALVGERPTHFGRTVLFAVLRDAEKVPERLSAHAMRAAVNRALLI